MNTMLFALLLAAPPSVQASATSVVRYEAAGAEDDRAEDEGTPDGCLNTYLCFKPPTSAQAAGDWIADGQGSYLLFNGLARFLAGFVPFLPFPAVWIPILLHYTAVPEEQRPALEGDLLMGILVQAGLATVASIVLIPLIYLPFGVFVYLGLGIALSYWIAPVTMLHLYNSAIRKEARKRAQAPRPEPRHPQKRRPRPTQDAPEEPQPAAPDATAERPRTGGVRVKDPWNCLTRGALTRELRSLGGDEALEMELKVSVEAPSPEVRRLVVLAKPTDGPTWTKTLEIPTDECADAARVVARMVDRHLR